MTKKKHKSKGKHRRFIDTIPRKKLIAIIQFQARYLKRLEEMLFKP